RKSVRSMTNRPVRTRRLINLRQPRSERSRRWSLRSSTGAFRPGRSRSLQQRLGKVWASPSTWYRLARKFGWRRPRLRVHPAPPKVGLRTTRPNEMWHIATTVPRLLDGTRAYVHAVIDNFSRRILAWRVAEKFAPVNSVAVRVDAGRGVTPSETT